MVKNCFIAALIIVSLLILLPISVYQVENGDLVQRMPGGAQRLGVIIMVLALGLGVVVGLMILKDRLTGG